MRSINDLRRLLGETLQLGARAQLLQPTTKLFGSIPELDSMSIVSVLVAIEEHFGFTIDDDEISADVFETMESLVEFVDSKLASEQ